MLILVRHGQTEANARGLLLGRADPPLSDTGRAQAHALVEALTLPTRILSSPLRRARQTATILARSAHTPVEVDERWVEMDYGDLDGRPASALAQATWQSWREDPDFVPAGGESVAQVGMRVRRACVELAEQAAREDVVVVSHVSPIKAAIAWALGVGDQVCWRMFLRDAAVCRIDTSGPAPVLLAFNGGCREVEAPDQSVWRASR